MKLFHVKHSADGQKSACQPFLYDATDKGRIIKVN